MAGGGLHATMKIETWKNFHFRREREEGGGGGGGRMLREIEVTADLPTFRNRKKFPAIKRAERAQALNRGFYS